MAKVLITGANGFIGSHLADRFLKEGHQVFGLVRKSSDLEMIKNLNISLRYGDITDYTSMESALHNIDILVHNAGLASDWGSLELFRKINLEGTKNTARAAEKNGVRRMVYMSSTAIHGFNHRYPACEDDLKKPLFNYAISKLEAENWVTDFEKRSSLEVTSIRPGNVFGPGDHTFIEKYIKAMISGKMAYINRGQSLSCPTFVTNLVHGVYLASFHENAPGEAFIITDGLSISWKQFTEAIAAEIHVTPPRISIPLGVSLPLASFAEIVYKLFKSSHAPLITKYRMYNAGTDYYFSIQKAKKMLGFKPLVDFDQSIAQTASWFGKKHEAQ